MKDQKPVQGKFNQENLTVSITNSCLSTVGDFVRVDNNLFKIIETRVHNAKGKITTKKIIVDVIDNKPVFKNIFEYDECQLVEPKVFDCDLSIFEIKHGDLVYFPKHTNNNGIISIKRDIDNKIIYDEYFTPYDENNGIQKIIFDNNLLIKFQTGDEINGIIKNKKFYINE